MSATDKTRPVDPAARSVANAEAEADREFPTGAEQQYPLAPSTVAAAGYTDEARYRRELDEVLLKAWFPIAPCSDIGEPRDFLVWGELEQSVVITRLDDGGIAAWHNVCQHRGARLVAAAEDIFGLDDDGIVVLKMAEVDDDRADAVRRAAYDCPTESITHDAG